jgi:hypothetical protein
VSVREAPQAEARRNPYLALERLTVGMGGRLTRRSDARVLDQPPAGSTLFLDRRRGHLLPPERLRRLLAWVEAGGHLIAVAEAPQLADPLARQCRRGPSDGASGRLASPPGVDQRCCCLAAVVRCRSPPAGRS